MPTTTFTADAFVIQEIINQPDVGAEVKIFSGTLAVNSLVAQPKVSGTLRKINGKMIGSLRITGTDVYIPVSFDYIDDVNLNANAFTFILPVAAFPGEIAADGFFRAESTAAVDTAGAFTSVTANLTGFSFTPGQGADTATITLAAVVVPFVPDAFDEPGDAMAFQAETVNALSEARVNQMMNPFDNLGRIVGIERLKGERNHQLAERVLNSFVHKGSSTGTGLANAITRDLALNRRDLLEISVLPEWSGNDSDVRIEIDDSWLKLYDHYLNDTNKRLDMELNLRDPNYVFISDVIEKINAESTVFRAKALIKDPKTTFSRILLVQGNWRRITQERVPIATRFSLQNKLLKHGSVFFSDVKAFKNEVLLDAELVADGDYLVNYEKGVIKTVRQPSGGTLVSYLHSELPFVAEGAEAVVRSFSDKGLRRHFFVQEAQTIYDSIDDKTVDALPTDEMFHIVKELLEAADVLWGP